MTPRTFRIEVTNLPDGDGDYTATVYEGTKWTTIAMAQSQAEAVKRAQMKVDALMEQDAAGVTSHDYTPQGQGESLRVVEDN